ncbi:hypothetical protein K4K49_001045 [Colletotrichum sp. SAR 10_70]|nr:hypothetical protein K4K49_001045 [Colletotrichum sp. SAR 10_70]
MKRGLPFNNIVDAKNIVELQDEWLYNMPAFFVPSTEIGTEANSVQTPHEDDPQRINSADTDSQRSTNSGRATSSGELKAWWVLDFRKSKSLRERKFQEKFSTFYFETKAEVKRFVAKGRTPDDAKKRWWVFYSLHPSENISHSREKDIVFPPLVDGKKPFCVTNVAMSFRFEGDFFDRYWTCRQLSADPEGRYGRILNGDQDSSEEEIGDDVSDCYEAKDEVLKPGLDVTKQRKCLELGIFTLTLQLMNESADGIMTKMTELLESGKDNLRKSFEATQGVGKSLATDEREMLDYKGFLVASKRFQEFQSYLELMRSYLDIIQSDLDLRRSEDIKRFTLPIEQMKIQRKRTTETKKSKREELQKDMTMRFHNDRDVGVQGNRVIGIQEGREAAPRMDRDHI